MKVMSTPYETGGRSAQKARTRDALVAAARDLVTAGVTPTVEDAAAAASISRTTAYRYFPNKRALLLAAHPEIAATSMLPANPPQDPAARLDAVVANFSAMILDTEAQQRTMLRLSLEADADRDALPLRQGRAIAWIAEALDGVRGDLSDAAVPPARAQRPRHHRHRSHRLARRRRRPVQERRHSAHALVRAGTTPACDNSSAPSTQPTRQAEPPLQHHDPRAGYPWDAVQRWLVLPPEPHVYPMRDSRRGGAPLAGHVRECGMRRFGELEAVIMERMWERRRPALVREVLDDLRGDRDLAYTTVMTVMDNLYRKGWLRRERDGRAWRYEPTGSRSGYTAALMNEALETSADRPRALAHFALQMSPGDASVLRDALDQALRESETGEAQ